MLEAVLAAGPTAGLADEVEPLELAQSIAGVPTNHRFEQRQSELAAQDRSRNQQRPRLRGEPVQARENHVLHGLGDREVNVAFETPSSIAAHEGAGILERAQELLQE